MLFGIVGETQVKTFFSYYAIFTRGLLFGLYKGDKFYLRLPKHISREELPHQLEQLKDNEYGIYDKNFYHIPDDVLFTELIKYKPLILQTLDEISKQKMSEKIKRKRLIRSMPNLNISLERTLKRLGLRSIEDVVNAGAYAIYVKMIQVGIEADHNLLFRLYGAIHKQHIYTMSSELKLQILQDANQALYDAGLRRRFKIS